MKQFVIVITGPTATGKSDFAEKVAQEIGGEIINADIGSWYTPLTIGTAKPDLSRILVPHHLFNILDKPERFTVVEFRNRVQRIVQGIWNRGKMPVIVGGSAFYIKSLWYASQESGSSSEIEKELMHSQINTQDLWRQLFQIDPRRAEKINENDRYRIVRALGIYQSTGKKPSSFEPTYEPIAPMVGIFCNRDRQKLYDRINYRTDIMLHDGWIKEVEGLMGTEWESFLIEKKIIGYDDIIYYLKSEKSFELYQKLVSSIQQKTRNYAKRQITFLSKLQKDLKNMQKNSESLDAVFEIDLDAVDIENFLKELKEKSF